MINLVIISIVFGSLIALAALICGTIVVILKARNRSGGGGISGEEAQMIQELYRGLERMETRIEALETILTEGREKEGL